MKQPEDNKTLDMYGGEGESKPKPKPERCTFWIEVLDGNNGLSLIEWRGLTRTQAERMNKATEAHLPDNVKAYGWEVTE
jgi:hypothetical protein